MVKPEEVILPHFVVFFCNNSPFAYTDSETDGPMSGTALMIPLLTPGGLLVPSSSDSCSTSESMSSQPDVDDVESEDDKISTSTRPESSRICTHGSSTLGSLIASSCSTGATSCSLMRKAGVFGWKTGSGVPGTKGFELLKKSARFSSGKN